MVFDKEYSAVYDRVYAAKDYAGECAYLEKLFRKAGLRPSSILDLGCGTGGHAVPLAAKGRLVTGVDRSSAMLGIAELKARKARVTARTRFLEADIARMSSPGKFDAVICMFAVMGYQLENADVAAVCRLAKESLNSGGVFVFDCWHGTAALTRPPETRVKEVPGTAGERVLRIAAPEMDVLNHTVWVNIRVLRTKNNRLSEHAESHVLRFFFPQEIKYYLQQAGFKKVDLYPFMETGRKLSASDWNMAVSAR